jgi:hypothetical protein
VLERPVATAWIRVKNRKICKNKKEKYQNLKIIENFKKLLLLLKNCVKILLLVEYFWVIYNLDKEAFGDECSIVGQNKKNQQAIA